MRRTFRDWGGRPWWYWRRLANRRQRIADRNSGPTLGDWTAGTDTTLEVEGGAARATRAGAGNPRIYREVSGLVAGADYTVASNIDTETASGTVYFRVSASTDLSSPLFEQGTVSGTGAVGGSFTAPEGGTVYIGIVAVCDTIGQSASTDETFTLEQA